MKPDGSFSATVKMIPEIEGVESTDNHENHLDEEEIVEEAEIKEKVVENGTTEISVGTENEESVLEIGTVDTPTDTENTESVQEDIEEEPVGIVPRTGRSIIKPMRLVE